MGAYGRGDNDDDDGGGDGSGSGGDAGGGFQEPPFLMNKASRSPGSNIKYEGFCIDLLEELSVHLDITYDIYLVNDQQYGRKLADGSWTGMIRQIIDRVSIRFYRKRHAVALQCDSLSPDNTIHSN